MTIYRQRSNTAADGYVFIVSWRKVGGGRSRQGFAKLDDARVEAGLRAEQLARGIADAGQASMADIQQLSAARALIRKHRIPLISALEEWSRAREYAGGAVVDACRQWATHLHPKEVPRISLQDAIDKFIAAKEADHAQGERTYRSKLTSLLLKVGNVPVHTVTLDHFEEWLRSFGDGVTRNDYRKRAIGLFVWLRDRSYFAADKKLPIELTSRVRQRPTEIGTITPTVFAEVLNFIWKEHPQYMPALVLNGLTGMRTEEVHGKRPDKGSPGRRMQRQQWEDIDLAAGYLTVTLAKENTPSWRTVPISSAACEWLSLIPVAERVGPVCSHGALVRVRKLCAKRGFRLPDNCFRHSYISHRVAFTKDKAACATDCGTSVAKIDSNYRRPILPAIGRSWFQVRPLGAPPTPAAPRAEFESRGS